MLCFVMSKKKKWRRLDREAEISMKRKSRGFFQDLVAGSGPMQRPKISAKQVDDEGRSVYGVNPEEVVIGTRTDEEVGRSR